MDVRRRMLIKKTSSGDSGGGSTTSGYTVVLNSQWQKSTTISNPDSNTYDGVYESYSNKGVNSSAAVMYIDISGLSEFSFYIRSYAESNYDYVMVSQLDKTITSGSSYSDTTLVKAHTRGNQQSGTSISSYTLVEFTGIDKGSHRITVLYRKDTSQHSNDDRGYVLIPREQWSSDSGGGSEGGDIIIDTNNYMTIYALEDGLQAKLSGNIVSYSTDEGNTWTELASNTYTPTINSGQTIMFKGNLTPAFSNGIGVFTINKKCNLEGNCMSLLFGDDAASNNSLLGKNYAFDSLFSGCKTIVEVSSTFLPATRLSGYCYRNMFKNCTSLVAAPELPATTLSDRCYNYMFYGTNVLPDCSNIDFTSNTEAGSWGLVGLFAGTKVTDADLFNILPINPSTGKYWLPATTLNSNCYRDMFRDCTSLTTAPELPATTLASGCYGYMFSGTNVLPDCSNIDFTSNTVVSSGGLRDLFAGTKVTDADLFNILPINPSTGKYWLPATTLASSCYSYMFSDCTSLTTAPELPATTLASGCYAFMFQSCRSLVTAPALPATTLANYCYKYMFIDCTSLVTAPELPATTLASDCYYNMFKSCNKLNYIKMLATDISASGCLNYWVSSVSKTGTFVKHPNMTSLSRGDSGIPSGWTVYNNGEEPEQESPQVAGDVAYYTNGEIKTISASKWNSSLGTPIGVVVIPSNFLPDGKARIVSLKAVGSSGNASTSHLSMLWSNTSTDTTLTNYTKVPITNNTGSVSSSSNSYGYLPSDKFTGDTSFIDSNAKYSTNDTIKIPSPYNGSEFNTDYSKTISGNNTLSDFNGLSNTQVLVGLGSDYKAANAAYNYSDGVSNTQWYLPSAGELGFLVARFKAINSTISMLSGVAVPSNAFWSSTEYGSGRACYVGTVGGYVDSNPKNSSSYVRPFASLV